MKSGFRVVFLLLWLILTFACALLLFTKGFLLKRVVVDQTGSCHSTHWLLSNLRNGLRTTMRFHTTREEDVDPSSAIHGKGCGYVSIPKFSKAVFVVIDGLRYDFLQHQKDVDVTMELPFQNKMKKVHHLLSTSPGNAKLFKFEADPPTTTMQRIKGITTGSLPTFVDAGTNFDSSAITEDNILDHVLKSGKNISFMGCSTWTELFPKHFHRKIPFSALNVKDLDTIDYGIMKNIYKEIQRDDWSLLIAHFLGVDHCGHRYGTHHHEMTRKLTEMDNVISELTHAIDEDTVLFVMGDHGMTSTGDHGGDSSDEVMAGLFVYSKNSIFPSSHNNEEGDQLPKVSQIDLVPTLSLLLDIPIPFSNLGAIIPQFFDGDQTFLPEFMQTDMPVSNDGSDPDFNWNNMDAANLKRLKEATSNVFKNINLAYASYVNCKQILRYLEAYQKLATDIPFEMIEAVRASFIHLEEQYEQNLEELVVIDWINKTQTFAEIDSIEENVQEMYYLHLSFQNVLHNFKTICRAVWAKFDIVAMSLGLSLMIFIALLCCITPFLVVPSSITEPHGRLTVVVYMAGFGFSLVGLTYLVVPFEDTGTISFMVFAAASFSFSLWLLSCSSSAIFFLHHHITVWRKKLPLVFANKRSCFYLACLVVYLCSLFANSYIIHEDTTLLFFVQSFILIHAAGTVIDMLQAQKLNEVGKPSPRGFTYLRTKLLQRLLGADMRMVYAYTIIATVALRLTRNFWFCREMQLQCNVSPYSLPLVALMSEFTEGYAHERLFVAFASAAAMAVVTYFYLKQRGNMRGSCASVVAVKLVGAVTVIILMVHWSLQLKLTDEFANNLFDVIFVQQIVLPRAVYGLCILSLLWLVGKPLCVFLVRRSKKDKVQEYLNKGNVAALYNIMKSNYEDKTEDEVQQRPMVYGLQTVYSASFVSLLFSVAMVSVMLLTDGLAFPVVMLWLCGWCVARFVSLQKRDGVCDNVELVQPVIVWSFFAGLGFFSSGHQTAISTIRYYAAYIGFKGSPEEMIFQVVAILFNTFAIPIICSLALPLLLIFRRLSFTVGDDEGEDEYLLNEYPDVSRTNLFKTAVAYLGILMLKVCFSAGSASLHRRHLMVWKIFGPRFMFEAVSFLLSSPVLLLGIMYFLRVDNKLSRWKEKLQKQQN